MRYLSICHSASAFTPALLCENHVICTLIRRVLQFLQPARDLRWDLLVIFFSACLSCSFADGDAVLECVKDIGESCCMVEDGAARETSLWGANAYLKREERDYERAAVSFPSIVTTATP